MKRMTVLCFSLLTIVLGGFFTPVMGYDLAVTEPSELKDTLSNWVILDARPTSEWREGHIPGAKSFSWENYTRTDENNIRYRIRPPKKLSVALGNMGIREKSPVVVYGDADKSWGGEGWACWVLLWLGHQGPVRLLNGGIQAWKKYGFPLTKIANQRIGSPVSYTIRIRPELRATASQIRKQGAAMRIVDTRSTLEWFVGRIPGAVHITWKDFFSGKERRPISAAEMKMRLKSHRIDTNSNIVYYCTGGIRSAYVWLVHQLSGLPVARNFEGGMEAWKRTE